MIIPGQLIILWPQVQYSDMPTGCALDKLQPGQDQKTGISIIPMYIKKGVFWKSYIFVCQQHTCKPKSYFIVSCRYHVYGLVVNTMHAMLAGAKSIILPKSVEKSRWEKYRKKFPKIWAGLLRQQFGQTPAPLFQPCPATGFIHS